MMHAEVIRAIQEDVGAGDITAMLLPEHLQMRAHIITREPMVMCGQAWAEDVFKTIDSTIEIQWLVKEGDFLATPSTLCVLNGPVRGLVTAERTALNFLQTLSGVATTTRNYVLLLGDTSTRLLDTRKTIPGLRYAQKYAVTCGGGLNHRLGLFDAFLIKENHIKAYGSIQAVIHEARLMHPTKLLEIEVETLEELEEALCAKVDRVMLDNFSLAMIKKAVLMNRPRRAMLEVSGGITHSTIKDIASLGIDYISVGAITKSVRAIDLSLLLQDSL
jgi:nicotinate-nucleotide pyrophosphorylase (carboxylating)